MNVSGACEFEEENADSLDADAVKTLLLPSKWNAGAGVFKSLLGMLSVLTENGPRFICCSTFFGLSSTSAKPA